MKLNKSVHSADGSLLLCEYDTDDVALSALWTFVFSLSLGLNILAIAGNSIIVLACFLQKQRPPLIIYIHFLAFSDWFYGMLAPFYTYRYVLQYWPKVVINFWLAGTLAHRCAVWGNTFSTFSSWLVVALTIDRLILVKLPTKARMLSTPKRAYIASIVIAILSIAVNAPYVYEQNEVTIFINECSGYWGIPKQITRADNSTYIPMRYNKSYRLYTIVSSVLIFYIIPACTILVSNVIIVKSLNSNKIQTENSQRQQAEAKLTKMIVVVSIFYVVCNFPDLVTRLLWRFLSPAIVSKVQPIAHLFLMVNVGANFFVYSLFNKHLFATVVALCARNLPFVKMAKTNTETSTQSTSA